MQCINCNVRLSRLRRHLLSAEDQGLVDVIKRWTYPADITDSDYICHACWELANYQCNNPDNQQRLLGHIQVCIGCGRSILRSNSRLIIKPNATEEERNIASILSEWIQPRQITDTDQACAPCWYRARRALQQRIAQGENQPDSEQDQDELQSNPELSQEEGNRVVHDPNPDLNTERCINCDMMIFDGNAHNLSHESDGLVNVIKMWIYPRDINNMDSICHACWELADHQANSRITCIVCGQEVSLDSCVQIIRPHISEEEQRIADKIREWVQPHQITTDDEACSSCWWRARGAIHEQVQTQPRRLQHITLPSIRRAAETPRHCLFSNCEYNERYRIPDKVRSRVLREYNFFIPRGARVCAYHSGADQYHDLYTSENSLTSFTEIQIEDMVFILAEKPATFDFEDIRTIPDNLVHHWLGINKQQHQEILDNTRLGEMRRGSLALTALLYKLRTGDSGERLSCLFEVPRRTVEKLMDHARDLLLEDYVPRHLGFAHINRNEVIEKNSIIANGLFGNPEATGEERQAIVICDGTYIYTQKSTNYLFQKDTYSLHKYRNLVKPFLTVCCDGYILDVAGPYSATTNDASIMTDLLRDDSGLRDFFNEGDIFILDRGFRDSINELEDHGFQVHMPETQTPGNYQLTTLEGNRSRCVTINRWVVEAVNGRIKRDFKLFRQEYFNRACPHLMKDLKIAAALLNAYATPFTDPDNAVDIVNLINERLFLDNRLADIVAREHMNRRNAMFTEITAANIYFPQLSLQELVLFACGTYQIRQARSYIGEQFRYYGIFTTEICREDQVDLSALEGENNMLIRAKIKSRHISRKTYFVFVAVDRERSGREAITGYCCNCIVGLRTVGCCSHVMSIIWYLSYGRHHNITPPAQFLDNVILRLH